MLDNFTLMWTSTHSAEPVTGKIYKVSRRQGDTKPKPCDGFGMVHPVQGLHGPERTVDSRARRAVDTDESILPPKGTIKYAVQIYITLSRRPQRCTGCSTSLWTPAYSAPIGRMSARSQLHAFQDLLTIEGAAKVYMFVYPRHVNSASVCEWTCITRREFQTRQLVHSK